jgi:hypothetical protein
MLFEAYGPGTDRYDLITQIGPPDAIVVLRTGYDDAEEIKLLGTEIIECYQSLWTDRVARVRMQIYARQSTEACSATIVNPPTPPDTPTDASPETPHPQQPTDAHIKQLSACVLESYRNVLSQRPATNTKHPPVMHDLCILPSGITIQYMGAD